MEQKTNINTAPLYPQNFVDIQTTNTSTNTNQNQATGTDGLINLLNGLQGNGNQSMLSSLLPMFLGGGMGGGLDLSKLLGGNSNIMRLMQNMFKPNKTKKQEENPPASKLNTQYIKAEDYQL